MSPTIVTLPGDGIGPEVTDAARRVLAEAVGRFGREVTFQEERFGVGAFRELGSAMPEKTVDACHAADAVLLGAVGDANVTSGEQVGLLELRQALGLYANLRPIRPFPELADASPLKPEYLEGVDFVILRELSEGLYFGQRHTADDHATDEMIYHTSTIERIVRVAAELAKQRGGRLTSVDKANVLDTSRLWHKTVDRIAKDEFPGLEVEHKLVDAMTMFLIDRPREFSVVVTSNMFGDILSDECSVLMGSLGMLPSASFGEPGPSLYEPVHGSAPDIAGQNKANPVGAILSAGMLAEHSLGWKDVASAIEEAVRRTVADGLRTVDIAAKGKTPCSTTEFRDAVIERLTTPVSA